MKEIGKRLVSDGRSISFLLVAGLVGVLFWVGYVHGAETAWRCVGVSHMHPTFADTRVVTAALECVDLGYDPLVENPCDPWNRPLNYPRVWLLLGHFFHLKYDHSTALGIGLAVAFLGASLWIVGKLTLAEGLVFAVFVASPPVMFAVERGNVDLLVFVLLGLALSTMRKVRFSRRLWAYGIVLMAGILKLYPALGLVLCFRERRNRVFWIAAVFLGIFAIYLAVTYADLHYINKGTPRSSFGSYGSRVLYDRLATHHLPMGLGFLPWAGVLIATVLGSALALRLRKIEIPASAVDSLRLGSAAYVATFMLGNNWNYRLVLLLLLAPGIFAAIRCQASRTLGYILLAATLAMLLLSTSVDLGRTVFCVREAVAWFTLVLCLALLGLLVVEGLLSRTSSSVQEDSL